MWGSRFKELNVKLKFQGFLNHPQECSTGFVKQLTCKNRQDGVVTNDLHTAVRKYDDVEEDGCQAQADDQKAQCNDCFYHTHGLRSNAIDQHCNITQHSMLATS